MTPAASAPVARTPRYLMAPLVKTTLARGKRWASAAASVMRSAVSLIACVCRPAVTRASSTPPSTMMPSISRPDRSARAKRSSSGSVSHVLSGDMPATSRKSALATTSHRPALR